MRFDLIPPDSLHAAWPRVKAGLLRVLEVSPERWLPEDVFTHLRLNRAQLYAGWDGERYAGFFVTENKKDIFTNEPYLSVWCLYGEPTQGEHFADARQFVSETMAFIDGLARNVGAKWIAMDGRSGWARYLKDWFEPVKVRYERKVSYV